MVVPKVREVVLGLELMVVAAIAVMMIVFMVVVKVLG